MTDYGRYLLLREVGGGYADLDVYSEGSLDDL